MWGKVLQVQMFGGFSMRYGGESVVMNKIGNSKSVRLLQMLLLSLKGGIAKNELIENLYGWNGKTDVSNRNRNLNNLIYRLKGQLVSGGLPEDEYVEINEGMCCFKSKVALETDVQKFELLVEQAKEAEGEERIDLLYRAVEMYSGELLPANQSDMWFIQKSNYFKKLYMGIVKELGQEYFKKGNYKDRLWLYTRASAIYPFENWQTQLIRCNVEMYRYEEAFNIYNDTMELYTRELGNPPMADMQKCFEGVDSLGDSHNGNRGDLSNWLDRDKSFIERKNNIEKKILGEKVKGAYYCTYPSFVDYCRLVVRLKERNKFSAVLMFLTLSQKINKVSQKQIDIHDQMPLLKKAIGDSVRIGDAYTRYGNRHFILMLIEVDKDSCSSIFQRIEKAYIRRGGKGELWYYADMTQELSANI